jgi:hypothetical protein
MIVMPYVKDRHYKATRRKWYIGRTSIVGVWGAEYTYTTWHIRLVSKIIYIISTLVL